MTRYLAAWLDTFGASAETAVDALTGTWAGWTWPYDVVVTGLAVVLAPGTFAGWLQMDVGLLPAMVLSGVFLALSLAPRDGDAAIVRKALRTRDLAGIEAHQFHRVADF